MENKLKLDARFDRALTWHRGGSYRYLVIDIEAPDIKQKPQSRKKPLNLALVIDRSGSMNGRPLEAAKEAAMGVAGNLTKADRLSVVCFDNQTTSILRSVRMDGEGKRLAEAKISQVHAGGTTDLAAGWLKGAELIAETMGELDEFRNQVVVLSDGHANRGETNPSVLAEYASGLQARGIVTSTVGIGDRYSPEVLQAIAENGGGRMHDAEHPQEIIEVVMAELGEVASTYGDQLTLNIEIPVGVEMECLSDYPGSQFMDAGYEYQLGSIRNGGLKQAVFQIRCPSGEVGETLDFAVSVSCHRDNGIETAMQDVALRQVHGEMNNTQYRYSETSLIVARIWQAKMMRSITQANLHRDRYRLREIEETEFRYFERYCRGLPGESEMIKPLHRLLRRAHRPMHERARKEVSLAAYKMQKCEPEMRHNKRDDWDNYISD